MKINVDSSNSWEKNKKKNKEISKKARNFFKSGHIQLLSIISLILILTAPGACFTRYLNGQQISREICPGESFSIICQYYYLNASGTFKLGLASPAQYFYGNPLDVSPTKSFLQAKTRSFRWTRTDGATGCTSRARDRSELFWFPEYSTESAPLNLQYSAFKN